MNYTMTSIDTDRIILAQCPLNVLAQVCKHWYNISLDNKPIRARLPTMMGREIAALPVRFYAELSARQKIALPNILLSDLNFEDSMRAYSTYKYKIPWGDITESDFMLGIFGMDELVDRFPDSKSAYYRILFKNLIQYRYYIFKASKLTFEQLANYKVKNGTTAISKYARYLWKHYRQTIPVMIEIIKDERASTEDTFIAVFTMNCKIKYG